MKKICVKNLEILFAACLLALTACADFSHVPMAPALPAAQAPQAGPYVIEAGDVLEIKFFYSQDLNQTAPVRPDGKISLQLVNDVKAEGLTPDQLDAKLTSLYKSKLPDKPDVSVIVKEFASQRIYVIGEVGKPGEFPLKNGMTAFQAIAGAGGFANTAGKDSILIIRQGDAGKADIYRADFSDAAMAAHAADQTYAQLMPRDVVYVPKSNVARADLFMDQHLRQLLLYNGINLGMSGVYEFHGSNINN